MRFWRRAAERRRRKKQPRCTSCGERVTLSEPDVTLGHHKSRGRLYFHERCALDACMAVVDGGPGLWMLTHRHVDERMN